MARIAIVTASDGVSRGRREDASGDALAEVATAADLQVAARVTVPDDRDQIAASLRRLADDEAVDLVVVTGGTGFGPRDVTPEATADVVDRPAPGLAEAMRAAGRASTPMADLSRGTAGIRGTTLVVDVPGSPRGAVESFEAILPVLSHALQLLAGDTQQHPAGHGADGAAPHDHGSRQGHHDHGHDHDQDQDPACAMAHGAGDVDRDRTLVAVSASPVALVLLHWGRELGWHTVLVEPDPTRVTPEHRRNADQVVATVDGARLDHTCDVVATDHDVDDLADHLAAALQSSARWIGLMGSPRHEPPHVSPLRERGFSEEQIARIERPIGLDLGSRTPPEIALATLAGLLADRNGRQVAITRP